MNINTFAGSRKCLCASIARLALIQSGHPCSQAVVRPIQLLLERNPIGEKYSRREAPGAHSGQRETAKTNQEKSLEKTSHSRTPAERKYLRLCHDDHARFRRRFIRQRLRQSQLRSPVHPRLAGSRNQRDHVIGQGRQPSHSLKSHLLEVARGYEISTFFGKKDSLV